MKLQLPSEPELELELSFIRSAYATLEQMPVQARARTVALLVDKYVGAELAGAIWYRASEFGTLLGQLCALQLLRRAG